MKRWILLAALLAASTWWYVRAHAPADWSGRPAPEPPRQWSTALPTSWTHEGYTLSPLAHFSARAIVLSRCNYRGGHDGALSRSDFALGWGPMSDAAVINQVKVKQDMRWYMLSWRNDLSIAGDEAMRSSANMHLIPANPEVARELARVRRHDLVEITGHLVEARHPDGWTWRSSLSRDDTGAGSCEVVRVESVKRSRPSAP